MIVHVTAVFNTVKDVKPLWMLRNGKKSKIDQVLSVKDVRGILFFDCLCEGKFIHLSFDGEHWSIDDDKFSIF